MRYPGATISLIALLALMSPRLKAAAPAPGERDTPADRPRATQREDKSPPPAAPEATPTDPGAVLPPLPPVQPPGLHVRHEESSGCAPPSIPRRNSIPIQAPRCILWSCQRRTLYFPNQQRRHRCQPRTGAGAARPRPAPCAIGTPAARAQSFRTTAELRTRAAQRGAKASAGRHPGKSLHSQSLDGARGLPPRPRRRRLWTQFHARARPLAQHGLHAVASLYFLATPTSSPYY